MAITTFIIGESGRGKSRSIKNLDPKETVVIKAIEKPLPFKSKDWKRLNKENPTGSIITTDSYVTIVAAMDAAVNKYNKKIIVIDDAQYIMANEFMRRSSEVGFSKYTELAEHFWKIITEANALPDDIRVYILSHEDEDQNGNIKAKTIGKLLDEKINITGMATIVLRAIRNSDGEYLFQTQNSGRDVCKSPEEMFDKDYIENDLKYVDEQIKDYYGIEG